MSNKKNRTNALLSLQEQMNAQDKKRTNANSDVRTKIQEQEVEKTNKPRSRVVSNIPWYPKSEALKKELKLIAIHEDTTLTGLIDEGIRMVLEKRGKDINDYI